MKKGDIIHSIYYQDHPEFAHLIEVLFETNQGWVLYKDFGLKRVDKPSLANWKLFSAFNERFDTDEKRIVTAVRLDEDMSLLVQLGTGDFIVVYFNLAVLVGNNSAQLLEIFLIDEVSETFKQLFDTAKEINTND